MLGQPQRVAPAGPPAPVGHRNNHVHFYDHLGITLSEHHYTYQIQMMSRPRATRRLAIMPPGPLAANAPQRPRLAKTCTRGIPVRYNRGAVSMANQKRSFWGGVAMRRVLVNTVVILGLLASTALAQHAQQRSGQRPVQQEASQTHAHSLAETEPRVSATPVRQFDRQPEIVTVQALIVTISFEGGKDAESTAPSEAGSVAEALTKKINAEMGDQKTPMSALTKALDDVLKEKSKTAAIQDLTGLELTTAAGQTAFVQIGHRKPRIVGATFSSRGRANNVSMENVGTIVQVTPQIAGDGSLVMEVNIERSDLGPEAEGMVIATTEEGREIRSPQIDTMTAKTTVTAANGQAVVVSDLICNQEPSSKETFVLLRPVVIRGKESR